jgi:hypothetical protein
MKSTFYSCATSGLLQNDQTYSSHLNVLNILQLSEHHTIRVPNGMAKHRPQYGSNIPQLSDAAATVVKAFSTLSEFYPSYMKCKLSSILLNDQGIQSQYSLAISAPH